MRLVELTKGFKETTSEMITVTLGALDRSYK